MNLVDGEPGDGLVSVRDGAVLRGDGCFETLRSYQGSPFELAAHLDRLERSAAALDLALPERGRLEQWIEKVAAEGGDCVVRVVVTRGSVVGPPGKPRCLVFDHPLTSVPTDFSLLPVRAPWHPAGEPWDLAGAKTLSYAPHQAATRRALRAGFDDALLVSREEIVLEGPTFSVAWLREGRLQTPALELSILDSITRRLVIDDARRLGIEVVEGSFPLSHLESASELIALSTTREVAVVTRLGDRRFPKGPISARLIKAYSERVQASSQGTAGR